MTIVILSTTTHMSEQMEALLLIFTQYSTITFVAHFKYLCSKYVVCIKLVKICLASQYRDRNPTIQLAINYLFDHIVSYTLPLPL